MSTSVTFGSLAVNSQCVYNGVVYTKTETVRVSCCKSVNAMNPNTSERTYIPDDAQVQTN